MVEATISPICKDKPRLRLRGCVCCWVESEEDKDAVDPAVLLQVPPGTDGIGILRCCRVAGVGAVAASMMVY